MDVMAEKNIRIVDSIFDPSIRGEQMVTYYKGSDNKFRYKVWIQLEGRDTYYVDYVTYRLHNTFPDPIRKVRRSITNPNCSLVIWTWGVFELGIEIILKTGEKISAAHYLSYDKQLLQKGLTFKEVSDTDPWAFM